MLRTGLTALLLLALLASASCGGGMASARDAAFVPVASLDRENSMGADSAQIVLVPTGDSYVVEVSGLDDAKAVYGQVEYDPSVVHLTEARANDGSSALVDGTLTSGNQLLMVVDEPEHNRVQFGMVVANWETKPGVTGTLNLATLTFANGPADIVRGTSAAGPPGNKNYNAIDLAATKNGSDQAVLTWLEALAGDGGNDGEVGLPDLTPLGARLNDNSGSSQAKDADYDKNGLPNISDLTALGSELHATLGGYKIMSAPSPTGPFTEAADIARNVMFPVKPPPGEVTWTWTSPAPLAANTSYKVVPYDNSGNKVLGLKESDVETLVGQPVQTITQITDITYDDPNGVIFTNNGTPQIILTEESVDGTADNVPAFSLEHLQLHAIADTNLGTGVDVTNDVLWYVTAGGGLANVDNVAPDKGDLTFHDRGDITVTAQVSGNFSLTKTISFQLLSIEAVDLQGPGASPLGVNAGGSVDFTVMGTFDSDTNIASGNEQTIDITPYVGWAIGASAENVFNLNQTTAALEVDGGAASGDFANISAEYPAGPDVPQLNDNLKRASPLFKVTVN